jgi:hypothetical protein
MKLVKYSHWKFGLVLGSGVPHDDRTLLVIKFQPSEINVAAVA